MAKAKTTQTSTNAASNTQVATPAPAAAPVNTQEAAPAKAVKRVAKKTETVPEQVAAPAPAPVATPAPAVQEAAPAKATKRVASKKTETATEQVAAPAPVATPAVQEAAPAKATKRVAKKEQAATPAPQAAQSTPSSTQEAESTENVSIEERINQLVSLNEQFVAAQRELSTLLKRAQKLHAREAKEAAIQNSRIQARRARAAGEDGERKRCGFSATPTLLSDGICTFLGIPAGSRLPRTDVNKLVTAYIKNNKLENPANRRSFIPDSKLQTLLGPLQDKHKQDGYSYFNIQTYLAQHFLKTDKQQTVAATQ